MANTDTLPNFFIVGAAKSGSTSLHHYLGQHPQVFCSSMKEPNYFLFEGYPLENDNVEPKHQSFYRRLMEKSTTTAEDYLALFDGVTDEKAIGEASASYLGDASVPARIHQAIPHAKLIVVLRNPITRAFSHYRQHIRHGRTNESFMRLIRQEEKDLSKDVVHWALPYYLRYGLYYRHLTNYLRSFDRSQVKIFLYEDLQADPIGLIQDTFRFLDVNDLFRANISETLNSDYSVPKNRVLRTLLTSTPAKTRAHLRRMSPAALLNWYHRKKRDFVKPQCPPKEWRALASIFREDVTKLQDLIQRDLSSWLSTEASPLTSQTMSFHRQKVA